MGKSWENHRKSWENHGKIIGKSWENKGNHGKIVGKSWNIHQYLWINVYKYSLFLLPRRKPSISDDPLLLPRLMHFFFSGTHILRVCDMMRWDRMTKSTTNVDKSGSQLEVSSSTTLYHAFVWSCLFGREKDFNLNSYERAWKWQSKYLLSSDKPWQTIGSVTWGVTCFYPMSQVPWRRVCRKSIQ